MSKVYRVNTDDFKKCWNCEKTMLEGTPYAYVSMGDKRKKTDAVCLPCAAKLYIPVECESCEHTLAEYNLSYSETTCTRCQMRKKALCSFCGGGRTKDWKERGNAYPCTCNFEALDR